jgi:plastocyanin
MEGNCAVKPSLLASLVGLLAIAASLVLFQTKPICAKPSGSSAVFDSRGRLKLPTGYRRWVYWGVSLTPKGVNKGDAQSRTVSVVIRGFKFDPETVTVNQGDTVEWKNNDSVPHTATEDVSKPSFDSGTIQTGSVWRYVARNKGTYNYTCTLHPNMEGKLTVQ